jgi:hypothetical protein
MAKTVHWTFIIVTNAAVILGKIHCIGFHFISQFFFMEFVKLSHPNGREQERGTDKIVKS